MFGKWTYLLYTLIYTVPLIAVLWAYFYKILKAGRKVVFIATAILTMYGFLLWTTGLNWRTWSYSSEKLLGIRIFGTILEDIIWWFLISLVISSFVLVMIHKEKGKGDLLDRT